MKYVQTLAGAAALVLAAAASADAQPAYPGQSGGSDIYTAQAAEYPGATRHRIGYGLVFSNDELGDGRDRWRTGSLTSSRVWGYGWDGAAPAAFGELLELRLQGQIIAPSDLSSPPPGDRPWAGALSAELHTHMQRGGAELSVGGGLVMTGPQTQLDDLQDKLHDWFDAPRISDDVRGAQIPNKFRPLVVAEAGHSLDLGTNARLRPFAEARAGDETLVRIGADLTIGGVGTGELLVRESVSGQRYRTVTDRPVPGFSFTLGGDIAHVADSIYLPEGRGYTLNSRRDRARLGLHWQGNNMAAFYGLTYLGKEFSTQSDSQLTGSIQVKLRF